MNNTIDLGDEVYLSEDFIGEVTMITPTYWLIEKVIDGEIVWRCMIRNEDVENIFYDDDMEMWNATKINQNWNYNG